MLQSIKTSVLCAILITTVLIAKAQKKINEGIITYQMAYDLTPDQEAMANMLPKESSYQFNGNMTKIKIDQGAAQIQVMVDQASKNGLLLIDIPMIQKQFAVKTTKVDYEKEQAANQAFTGFETSNEKQKIAGYNATKYTYKDDKGNNFEAWATTDIETPRPTDDPFKAVKGTLLKYTIFQHGTKVTLTVKEIKETKVEAISLEVPNGYELKTMDELNAMRGGQ